MSRSGSVVAPSAQDPVARAASEVAGGPAGSRIAPRGPGSSWWSAGPVLVLAGTALLALAAATRGYCRATDWGSPGQFTHLCYSDVASRVASGTIADQPPGAALLTRLLEAVTGSVRSAFDVGVLLSAVALAVAITALVASSRPGRAAGRGAGAPGPGAASSAGPGAGPDVARPWDAAALALSPVLITAGVVSLELVAVAGVAVGLLAQRRAHPFAAGIALALAASVDPLAVAVLLVVWCVALAAGDLPSVVTGALGAALATSAVAVAARWAGVVGGGEGVGAVLSTWLPGWNGQPGYGSLWVLPTLPYPQTEGAGTTAVVLPSWLVVGGAVLGSLAVAALVVRLVRRRAAGPVGHARRGGSASASGVASEDASSGGWGSRAGRGSVDPVPALALVAVVGLLVVSPTVPVQSCLLLLPLVALSGVRWRDQLLWAGTEVLATSATWLYIYGQQVPSRGVEPWTYAAVVVLRVAGMLWVARSALRGPAAPPVDDGARPLPAPVVLSPLP